MPIPAQTPHTVNKEWRIFIKDSAFQYLYEIYNKNFDTTNNKKREYSVIWFHQVWKTINQMAGSRLRYGIGSFDIQNDYDNKKPPYGYILYNTKRIYNRSNGKYYDLLIIQHIVFHLPYTDKYGGRIVKVIENQQNNLCYNSIIDYINEQKYINTTYKMKSLQQYISEQMVSEGIKDLFKKKHKSPKQRNENEQEAINKLPILLELEKRGFNIIEIQNDRGDDNYWVFINNPSIKNIEFGISIDKDNNIKYNAYDCEKSNENDILLHKNGKTKYLNCKLQNKNAIKVVVDFGKICGFDIDKNEIKA